MTSDAQRSHSCCGWRGGRPSFATAYGWTIHPLRERRLRRRLGITPETPLTRQLPPAGSGDGEVDGAGAPVALTSGTSGEPKRVAYPRQRLSATPRRFRGRNASPRRAPADPASQPLCLRRSRPGSLAELAARQRAPGASLVHPAAGALPGAVGSCAQGSERAVRRGRAFVSWSSPCRIRESSTQRTPPRSAGSSKSSTPIGSAPPRSFGGSSGNRSAWNRPSGGSSGSSLRWDRGSGSSG